MKLKIITLFLCCFSLVSAWSQSRVSGNVSDESKLPMIGVTVLVKGTSNGVATDFDGNFNINVKKGQVLKFIYVGFKTITYTVGDEKSINIVMKEDVSELDELIIIGYGSTKKGDLLGSVAQVKGQELVESGASNLTNALSGITPGVIVVQESGQPGDDAGEIFIRGEKDPLILVDGVEIVGGAAQINPRDIESVSILKDGAATAVYGIRGANGVIIYTTKRGVIGKPKVSFSSEFSIKSLLNRPDNILDAYSAQKALNTGILNDQAYDVGYSSPTDLAHYRDQDLPYVYPNTDWDDIALNNFATSLNQTVSVRGGNEFVKYYASASYLTEGDIIKSEQLYNYDNKFKFDKYTFRGNLDFTLSKTTRLKTSVSSRLEDKNQPGNADSVDFLSIYNSERGGVVAVYPESVLEQYPDPLYPIETRYGFGRNLYTGINLNGNTTDNKTVFSTDIQLEQDLDVITKGLKFTGQFNYISSFTTRKRATFDGTVATRPATFTLDRDFVWQSNEGVEHEEPLDYILGNETINASSDITTGKVQLDYSRSFGKHNVEGLATFRRNKKITNVTFPFYNEDYIGRVKYNYDSRYYFEVNGSYNGDETFAEGYRFKFFPSFTGAINLAKEDFIKKNIPSLSNFKITYSHGETGSKTGLGNARWQYLSFYDFYGEPGSPAVERRASNRYYFGEDIDDPLLIVTESEYGNEILTWSTVTKQNLKLDFGFLNNTISGTVEYFKNTKEGLIEIPTGGISALTGIKSTDLPFVNFGESESHGYEVSLTYKNNTAGGFKYSATAFYGFYENRVLRSGEDGAGVSPYTSLANKPVGAEALLQTDGYFQNIDEVVNYPDFTGNPGLGDYRYIDYNANGSVSVASNDDLVRFDLPDAPKHTYSVKLNASYKGWSFGALINGVEGHRGLVNNDLAYAIPDGTAVGLTEHLDYWTPTNRDAAYPSLHASVNPNAINSTARIIDLDYIKLRSANLTYNFNVEKNKTFSALSVYLNGNNLFVLSNINFGDPEKNNPAKYPVLRRFNLGINMTF